MASATSRTVDPLLPLSLLEAVRDADRPEGAAEAEYVPELLNKRLGTTDTVYVQIRRYAEAVKRGHPVGNEEVTALARLIGRRPDAHELFRSAGRSAARTAYHRLSAIKRAIVRHLPRFIARPLARSQARRIISRYFGASLRRNGQSLLLDVPARAPLAAGADMPGRAYYDAALDELLSLLTLS